MAGTVIPSLTAQQFAQRLAALFPNGWAAPDATQQPVAGQPTGLMAALLLALATQLAFWLQAVRYARSSILIDTATAPELDLASRDYFGEALPRPTGMTDADFAALIKANLFPRAATRATIANALQALTGAVPRMVEPWNPGDTGALDAGVSYLDVDTRANPCRVADGYAAYQGFIDTVSANNAVTFGQPLLVFDDVAFIDGNAFAVTTPNQPVSSVYALIDRLHAYGTTIWVRLLKSPPQ